MNNVNSREKLFLILGDFIFLIISLWLALFLRFFEAPDISVLYDHAISFIPLFVIWFIVFYISGLYEKQTKLIKNRIPALIAKTQIINAFINISFFYFVAPYLNISPKTNLFIYLFISTFALIVWRLYFFPKISKTKKDKAIMVGSGNEVDELVNEVNNNDRYPFYFSKVIDPDTENIDIVSDIKEYIKDEKVSMIILDARHPKVEPELTHFYTLMFNGVFCIEFTKLYEEVFDRVPVSFIGDRWFIENTLSVAPKLIYDSFKRILDITASLSLFTVSLLIYPFVILAIKLEDKGKIFSYQYRVGQYNKTVKIVKFRTMTVANDDGKWGSVENKVTKVGVFLRKSRIDELPQLLNVMRGDISLIGPRPEFPDPVSKYTEQIPYYNIRHIIKPGLSGWAQIYHEQHPHHGLDIDETRNKLSYDLYYVKHRSLTLDFKITLRTIKVLFSFMGR